MNIAQDKLLKEFNLIIMNASSIYEIPSEIECYVKEQCEKQRIPYFLLKHSAELRKFDRTYFADTLTASCSDTAVLSLFSYAMDAFESCPASTKYHGSYFGGLLDHTLTVCEIMYELLQAFIPSDDSTFRDSALKCCFLHDIGKLGTIATPMYVVNPDFSKHNKEPFIWNETLVQMPHEQYSIYLINQFKIQLTPEEYQAIAYHNGYYVEGTMQALRGNESKLTLLLHTADNFASKIRGC
jgi:hypothetical protein